MKKVILKRTVALIFIFVLLCVSVLPCFAAVDWYTCFYIDANNQGNLPYNYATWQLYLAEYYESSNQTVYFFEVQNTELGGTRYAPTSIQWVFAYGANQSGWGDVDLVYRFYVPYYGSASGWNFQIRTAIGAVAFDSSNATLYQHSVNANIGYYEFTIDSNLLGFRDGWYIYSNDLPPGPLNQDGVRYYNVQFDYYHDNSIVGTRVIQHAAAAELVVLSIPGIPGFQIYGASGPGTYSGGDFIVNSLLSDIIIQVDVYSINDLLEAEYQLGYERGKQDGRSEGIIQGIQDYKNSLEYRDALNAAYQDGWDDAIESGETGSGVYPPINNPLRFVMSPVVSFLRMEIFPGLEMGTLFLATVAVSLIVIFLKIFAGG